MIWICSLWIGLRTKNEQNTLPFYCNSLHILLKVLEQSLEPYLTMWRRINCTNLNQHFGWKQRKIKKRRYLCCGGYSLLKLLALIAWVPYLWTTQKKFHSKSDEYLLQMAQKEMVFYPINWPTKGRRYGQPASLRGIHTKSMLIK